MSRTALALLVLLVLAQPALRAEPEFTDLLAVPGTEGVPDLGAPGIDAVLVVEDDGQGRFVPIQGARVTCWTEDCRGVSLGSEVIAEGTTGAHGVAVLEGTVGAGEHWLVTAKGFCAYNGYCYFGRHDEVVVLERGEDRRLRILDPFGKPLAGAQVEVVMGCPHSPAAREGVTDADGLVTLGPVDDEGHDLWIEAPGVAPNGHHLEPIPCDGSVRTVLTRPARTARGVVVDAEGECIVGATVRELGYPRGPKTATDAEGRFVLHGCTGDTELGVFLPQPPFDETPAVVVSAFSDDVPLRLAVDPSGPVGMGEGETRHRLDVALRDADTKAPIEAARLADGYTARTESGGWRNSFQVPPGRYRVRAGGRFSSDAPVEVEIDVPTPDREPVTLHLEKESGSFGAHVPEGAREWPAELRIEGYAKEVSLASPYLEMPPTGRAALVVWSPRPLVFDVPEAKGDDRLRKAVIELPAATSLRLRAVDAEGEPLEAEIEAAGWPEDLAVKSLNAGWIVIRTRGGGAAMFDVWADGTWPKSIEVSLPDASAVIDLGDVVLRPEVEPDATTFRVLDGEGNLVPDAWIDGGVWGGGEDLDEGDEEGTLDVSLLGPKRCIVTAKGFLPMPATLDPEGGTDLQFPRGRIEITITDEAGRPVEGVVWLDGHGLEPGADGVTRVRGVPLGEHRFLLGAEGRRGAAGRVTLTDSGTHTVRVTLPAR